MIPLDTTAVSAFTQKDGKLIMILCYSSFISLTVRSFDEKPIESENFYF
jgi:hypothetical protein